LAHKSLNYLSSTISTNKIHKVHQLNKNISKNQNVLMHFWNLKSSKILCVQKYSKQIHVSLRIQCKECRQEKSDVFVTVIDVQVLNIDMNETCPFVDFMIKLERYREEHIRNRFKKLFSGFLR